jgi:tetratricopeptide (TPR) repeat protein
LRRRTKSTPGPKLPLIDPKGKPPREVWDDYFSKRRPDPRVVSRLILELHKAKKYDHVIAAIEAALAAGQAQPWMYDVMVGSLRIVKRPQSEINRVLASRIDITAGDVDSMLYTAAYFVRLGGHDLALRLYRQASRIDPTRPEPYVLGLKLAREKKDYAAVQWAATGILVTAWTRNHLELHKQAEAAAADAARELKKAGRGKEAAELAAAMAEARKRDLVLKLEWAGAGDLDLIVEEPPGTVCSSSQPQTANGGVLLHDGFGPRQENCYEEYICAMGRPGKYRVRIRHVYGNIVGKRAVLTVIRNLGTPDESVRKFPVPLGQTDRIIRLSLPAGRRTALVIVPPKDEQLAGVKRIPRLRRIFATSPAGRRAAREFAATRRMFAAGNRVGYQPVISTLSEGVSMTAMAVVSGDRRYVRIGAFPAFTNITDVFTFSFVNTGNPNGGGGGGGIRAGGGGGAGIP